LVFTKTLAVGRWFPADGFIGGPGDELGDDMSARSKSPTLLPNPHPGEILMEEF
jgi:hypothetical protein